MAFNRLRGPLSEPSSLPFGELFFFDDLGRRQNTRGQKLNPNIFFSNFSGASGISRQNPGISRQKSLIPWVSRDIPNFLGPTPSRGRPPPHQKISGLKSLGLGSFFVPEKNGQLTNSQPKHPQPDSPGKYLHFLDQGNL